MKINLVKISLLIFTTLIMFVSNLMAMNIRIEEDFLPGKWQLLLIYTFILLIIMLFTKSFSTQITHKKIKFIFLWIIFIAIIFISKHMSGGFNLLEFILYILIVPIVFFSNYINRLKNIIKLSFVISVLPFFAILGKGTENTLGILLCLSGLIVVNYLSENLFKDKDTSLILITLLIGLFVFMTQSRTALITYMLISGYLIFKRVTQKDTNYWGQFKKILTLIIAFSFIGLLWEKIDSLLFKRDRINNSDLTSGRTKIWEDILQNKLSILGSEINYREVYFVRDAHNTYLQVLADYGWLSLLFFLIIVFIIIYQIIRIKKVEYTMFFGSYFILSFSENLFLINNRLIGIHILFLIYLGCLIGENIKREKHKVKNIKE